MKRLLILSFMLGVGLSSPAQQMNTLSYNEMEGSPAASLIDIEWIAGLWRGEAFGGMTEEIWSPPLGNSMMCAFKLIVDGKINFYELTTITEENGSLILRLKHFHSNLKGWEDKDVTQDFKLVKVSEGKVYFDSFTFHRISKNEINMYVVMGGNGEKKELKFNYKRADFKTTE